MQRAVICLLENDFPLPAVMLVFTTIDQMAWVALPGDEDVRGKDFMAWVTTYMLGRSNAGLEAVTAGDLWGARCGLLHTATADSSSLKKGIAFKRIAYSHGAVDATSLVSEWTVVKIEDLVQSLLAGVLWFRSDLDAEPERAAVADAKVARMLRGHSI